MDFDSSRLYYSHQQLQQQTLTDGDGDDDVAVGNSDSATTNHALDDVDTADLNAVRRHFREFLRNYRLGTHRYLYRDKLLRMHRRLSRGVADGTSISTKVKTNMSMLDIDIAHLGDYDPAMLGYLRDQPATILPTLELAASDALESLLYDLRKINQNNDNDEERQETNLMDITAANPSTANATNGSSKDTRFAIQVLLKGNLTQTPLRGIRSEHVNRLLKCPGIITHSSPVMCRATHLVVRCSKCLDTRTFEATDGPFGNIPIPNRCQGDNPAECGPHPYSVVPDDSAFVDRQKLKLQEAPERVPTGEMPRSVMVAVERSMVDRAPPGTRVTLFCIPTLLPSAGSSTGKGRGDSSKVLYLRAVGLTKDSDHGESTRFSPAQEEAFCKLAQRPDVFEILTRSMAPSIRGNYTVDIKKALICMLLGGTRKHLPDGMRLRGDINVLLLGDPSTAKSQFLKFVSKVAPIGIYTSGKGSSAAGLTASVVRDGRGEFYLEGGAMVLADGGIVCIDEFDKMRPADRVAIHEAMEQQTISIAKAGITTVLNSRSAVLAAANPVFGRYDDLKSASENIDLMTTILSRFDLIFLVRDVREEERDRMICKHVMGVHIDSSSRSDTSIGDGAMAFLSSMMGGTEDFEDRLRGRAEAQSNSTEAIAENVMRVATTGVGELEVPAMKKFIQYAKAKCHPVLSEEAGEVLTSSYVKIRDDVRKSAIKGLGAGDPKDDGKTVIPITVRQLEALVRISESLAKLRLDSEVRIEDVNEALRLFRNSTMAANAADQKVGENSLLGGGSREEIDMAQSFLRSRMTIGSMVNKQRLIEEASGQGYNAMIVTRVLSVMAMRGELLERNQGRLLKRVK